MSKFENYCVKTITEFALFIVMSLAGLLIVIAWKSAIGEHLPIFEKINFLVYSSCCITGILSVAYLFRLVLKFYRKLHLFMDNFQNAI